MNSKLKMVVLATIATIFFASTLIGTSAEAKTKKKTDPAKRECLAENPKLKGKKLTACIKRKKKASKKAAAQGVGRHHAKATPNPMMDSGPGAGHESEMMPQMTPPQGAGMGAGATGAPGSATSPNINNPAGEPGEPANP